MKVKRLKNMKMTTKIVLAFITMILLAALMGGGSLWSIFQLHTKSEVVSNIVIPQYEGSSQVEKAVLKVTGNLESYKFTRDGGYLEKAKSNLDSIKPLIQGIYDSRDNLSPEAGKEIEAGYDQFELFTGMIDGISKQHKEFESILEKINTDLRPVIDEMMKSQEEVTDKFRTAEDETAREMYADQAAGINNVINIMNVMMLSANGNITEIGDDLTGQVKGMLSAVNNYVNSIPVDGEIFTKQNFKTAKEKIIAVSDQFSQFVDKTIEINGSVDELLTFAGYYLDGAEKSAQDALRIVNESARENTETVQNTSNDILWLFLIIMIIGISFSVLLPIYLAGPLKKLRHNINKFGGGDLTVQFNVNRDDEVGQIAKALTDMSEKLRGIIGDISLVTDSIDESSEVFSNVSQKQAASSEKLMLQSQEIDCNAQEAASSVEEVNETVAEVAQGSQMITENTQDLSRFAGETSEKAEDGNTSVKSIVAIIHNAVTQSENTQNEVTSLADYAQNVMGIVDTIKAIAEQTNLLALNAAIEAARAGEAGTGFAVVADEIRKLADESKDATDKIYKMLTQIKTGSVKAKDATLTIVGMIGKIDSEAKNISDNFAGILKRISQINERIENLTASSEEQSASSEEISAAVERIAYTVDEISKKIQGSTEAVETQNRGMKEIENSSDKLKTLASKLKSYVEEFKI